MKKIGFDSEKFISLQRDEILKKINKFNGKLYMEMGGKIFDDLHASRVLPGYNANNKIKLLQAFNDQLEIILCISARDIENNKLRADFGITYDMEVLRLIEKLKGEGLSVNSVCITLFNNQPTALKFGELLKRRGEKVYFHGLIEGYPNDIDTIVSDQGYSKNQYIPTTKPLVVVAAPGPGSCKLATCLSQIFHEYKMGLKSGYAKFESFPVWDLPLDHPVNRAYEAATADLQDVNVIDCFHMKCYGCQAVNYNRDLEAFPVLTDILFKITGETVYNSPTDMGVNVISKCIVDDSIVRAASQQEIIRRFLKVKVDYKKGRADKVTVDRNLEIMLKSGLRVEDRAVVNAAHQKQADKGVHAVAIQLHDGTLITGKDQGEITATAGAVLNALKYLAGIEHENIVNREAVARISQLKTKLSMGSSLNLEDIFVALSIYADMEESSRIALEKLDQLFYCEVHSTCILSNVDEDFLRKLNINLTCDDVFAKDVLFD